MSADTDVPSPDVRAVVADGAQAERGEKLALSVARAIVKDIVRNGFQPEAKLPPENVMVATYGVGRASVREALRILEILGLVTMKPGPGGGPVIGRQTSRHFGGISTLFFEIPGITYREMITARLHLEPLLANLATSCRDDEQLEMLARSLEDAETAGRRSEREYMHSCMEFHDIVADMSGNQVLALYAKSLKDVWRDRMTQLVVPAHLRDQIRLDHHRIGTAILKQDATRAEVFMRQHMEDYIELCESRIPAVMDVVVDWR